MSTAGTSPLTTLDATAQAALIRDGEVSREELLEATLAAVERGNPGLNAVVHLAPEAARSASRAVDAAAPLAGVPMLLKDLVVRKEGFPATDGSRAYADRVAGADSELVRRYEAAGLVIVGQTNTAEFGSTPTTESTLFGPARNPWDGTRTAGGSSGGSAAAVAARMVALAHGNDGGGSVRIPASCCGVFGLKPSVGRTPVEPGAGALMGRTLANHVITRSVRDSALVLDCTAGPAFAALTGPGLPVSGSFLAATEREPGPLRIAVSRAPLVSVEVHPECVAAVDATVALCEELGHEVVEAEPSIEIEPLMRAWFVLWTDLMASLVHGSSADPREHDFDPLVWSYYVAGRRHTALEQMDALAVVDAAAVALHRFMEGCDAWLTPTLAQPPLVLGRFSEGSDRIASYLRFSPFTRLANISGQPAMSVPLHWSADGLPIGSHFLGRFGREGVLFGLAAQLEAARPWADRVPPAPAGVPS